MCANTLSLKQRCSSQCGHISRVEARMRQQAMAMAAGEDAQYEQYHCPVKRDTFLATMEKNVP